MAAYSLFEDDEVCHVTPEKTYHYGLVLENADTVSSDEEDSRPDFCKKGCVRVAWHPKGRESVDLPENKVLLADRTLMPSDVVRRLVPGQDTQCGFVQDLEVLCHLHITGTDKYIYNVNSKHLSPCIQFQKFDGGYITLDNWLGRVEEVRETITIVFPDGARAELDDSDVCCLEDVTEKRLEDAVFNEEYCYPGQQLKGVLGDLSNANWLNSTLLNNARNVQSKKNSTFYASVEKVQISTMYVHWICRGYSKVSYNPENKLHPPPREVTGADVERVQLVDWFEHCSTKLGDKMFYTIREEDVLETQLPKHRFIPHAVQHATSERLEQITHRHEDILRLPPDHRNRQHKHRGSKKGSDNGSATASNSGSTVRTVDSATSTSVCDAATETEDQDFTGLLGATAPEKGGGDMDAEAEADDEYEDVEDGDAKVDDSGSDAGSVSSSASGAKRRKRERSHGLATKSLKNTVTGRRPKRGRPPLEIPTTPGTRVATEVCYTFTLVSVMWQDGSVEEKIPSVDLFPMHHLDELEFFPGSFVVDATAADTSNEYGVVMSCNHFERTCHVKWLKPYEVGQGTFPTEVIKASEVSVYDIYDHPDYKFRPGHSVIRVAGFETADQTMQAVGQVVRLNPDGTIIVNWCDGSSTSSYPQDLYIVWDMSDYSNTSDEWESMESMSSEETDSDPSWETEEEEEQKGMGDEDADGEDTVSAEEEPSALKDMTDARRKTIKQLLEQAQIYFNELADLYAAHTVARSSNANVSSLSQTSLLKCMNGILKIYKSCRKLDKVLKTVYFSVPEVVNLVSSIKYDIKREKSKKIKQHLDQVFESSNRNLLEGEKPTAEVTATAGSGMGDTQVTESGGKPADAESGPQEGEAVPAWVNMEQDDGTSVDGVAGAGGMGGEASRARGRENAISSSVDAKDYSSRVDNMISTASLREIERDISSMLAAANVGEDKATGAVSLPNGNVNGGKENIQNGGTEVDGEDLKSSEACAPPEAEQIEKLRLRCEDLEKSKNCLETVHNISQLCMTLCKSLQETIDTIYAAMDLKDDSKNTTTDKPQETSGMVEAKTGFLSSETIGSTCPVHWVKDEAVDTGCDLPESQDTANLRADSQDAYATSNSSNASDTLSPHVTATVEDKKEEEVEEEEEEEEVDESPAGASLRGFQMCGEAPASHRFFHHPCHPSNPRSFNAAVKKELKLLKSSLPEGIIVKGYEDRMDLFSALVEGPANTPYEDGVFMFDVMLPHDYPANPPHFKYLSFCLDRLNPNLYGDGKVCVSLLGTWSGKGMEVWTDKSSLLQVLVSIQGLILVDEPYYNEAGYEKQRGQQIASENSRLYNEMAILKLVESLTAMAGAPPKPFTEEVEEWLLQHGLRLRDRLTRWMALSERMGNRQQQSTTVETTGASASAGDISPNKLDDLNPSDQSNHAPTSTQSAAPAEEGGAEATDTVKDCSQVSRLRPKRPAGHPDFPLLPLSKGFRLTLQKSLGHLEAALTKLQQSRQGPDKAELGATCASDTGSEAAAAVSS